MYLACFICYVSVQTFLSLEEDTNVCQCMVMETCVDVCRNTFSMLLTAHSHGKLLLQIITIHILLGPFLSTIHHPSFSLI